MKMQVKRKAVTVSQNVFRLWALYLMHLIHYLVTQALLLKAHEVEVKKEKENKILKQLAFDKDDGATEVRLRPTSNNASSENADFCMFPESMIP